ncbi:MAG: cytochrome c oxidase assembly protein [Solirubrobacteraceae bacterium]
MSFGHWQIEPTELAPVIVLVIAYWRRARVLAAKRRPVARRRQAAFAAGIAVLVLALISPLDWYGENRLLWVHMIQHLAIGDIAAPLIVLGLTGALLGPLLRVRLMRRLRVLAHPLVALPLWIVDLYVWHLPVLYQAALNNDQTIHPLEHICFFVCGALMWAAVIEPLPGPRWFTTGWKFAYTFVVRVAETILANVFIWGQHPYYAYYLVREHSASGAVGDQRIAGLIMFVEGSFVTLGALVWLFLRFMREAEIRQRLIDRGVDVAVATRAARSSNSARVREVSR